MNTDLIVRPVRRYTVPKYPSYLDPNPAVGPQAPAYPGCREVFAALASLGIGVAGAAPQTAEKETPPPPITANDIKQNIVYPSNPIDFYGGMHFGGFGTVSPGPTRVMKLSDKEINDTIEGVFKQEGFELERNIPVKTDSVEFEADGYNSKSKIGYEIYTGESEYRNFYPDKNHYLLSWDDQVEIIHRAAKQGDPVAKLSMMYAGPEKDKGIQEWLAPLHAIELSKEEAMSLEKNAPQDKCFVLVVDKRHPLIDPAVEWNPLTSLEKAQIETFYSSNQYEKAHELEQKYYDAYDQKALKEAKEKLAKGVRDYIRWARSQGLE